MPIEIIYNDADTDLAHRIQQDIAQASLRLDHAIVIVLLSPDAHSDPSIQQDVTSAQAKEAIVAPVMIRSTQVPEFIEQRDVLDLSKKYNKARLIAFIKRTDLTQERRRRNRQLLYIVGGAALVMFIISLASISANIVAFPVDEYATENAIRDSQIATIVAPQIEELRPRTTEDALNFEATLDAVGNDDLVPFIAGTATAIPQQLAATSAARQTQAIATEAAQTQAASE